MKVESKGGDTYAFDFGGGVETIIVDGTDQPGLSGTQLSVKAEASDVWIVTRKQGSRVQLEARWKLSGDGGQLTDYYREFEPDGSVLSVDYVYTRAGDVSGRSGFAGAWRSIKETINSPFVLKVSEPMRRGTPGSVCMTYAMSQFGTLRTPRDHEMSNTGRAKRVSFVIKL